jgi:hypothetical protein
VTKRYVAVHPTLGILLTAPAVDGAAFDPAWDLTRWWSKDKPEVRKRAAAVTVQSWAELDMLLSRCRPSVFPDVRRALKLHEVYPDGPEQTATPEGCLNAGLSRWDEEVE